MVPALTKGGRSFKGAAAYYLHDKREAGEAERSTSARIAWTETINLLTEDPDRAWRMMATTALAQAELKKAAGIKAGGRKLESPVFAYSLAWHPDEKPTKAQQLDAARATLKLLGLEEHQAIIIAHNDEPHAHVHVIANRVHPVTGKAATLSNSQRIVQDWALKYEQEQGKILCPARAENAEKRKRGEKTHSPRVERPAYEFNRQIANGNIRAAFVRTEQAQKDAALHARTRAMNEAHRRQWAALKKTYAEARAQLYRHGDARRQRTAEAVRDGYKSEWRDLFKKQERERRQFDAQEHSLAGRFRNIGKAIREAGWQEGTAKGILGAVFNMAGSARRTELERRQQGERDRLAATVKASARGATDGVKISTRGDAERLRADYLARCEALRNDQDRERDQLQGEWRTRNDERRAAFEPLRIREAGRDLVSGWDRARGRGGRPEEGRGRERDQGRDFGIH